ncbi:MAG: Verru_Chthon cassette protein D [Verrucomicrobiota bacterium]
MKRVFQQPQTRAFSLIEMMIVVGMIAVMLVMFSVGLSTSFVSGELSTSARQLARELEHGAQLATLRNRPVTVRFTSDLEEPDENYQGFQIGITDGATGEFVPTTGFFRFPGSVTIHRDERTSTLLRLAESNAAEFEFQFRADGTTTLPKDEHWCVTLVRWEQGAASELPSNYRTVVVNPYNGSTTLY